MTPDERSRAYCPSEWTYDNADEIRVLILVPVESDAHDPAPPYQIHAASGMEWGDPQPRFARCLRIARDGLLLLLVIGALYGAIAGITWGAWKVFS